MTEVIERKRAWHSTFSTSLACQNSLMFAAKPNNPDYKACSDAANSSTVMEVIEKKGGVAFSIEYKSSVPKLPPINLCRALVPLVEDYEKWKGTC